MKNSRRTALRVRTLGAAVVLGAALSLSGCGFDSQTLQPYTQAQGVNVDEGTVKVRNLLIIADDAGNGVLAGSFAPSTDDTLRSVTGVAVASDGTQAGVLTVTGIPVSLPGGKLTVLTSVDAPVRVTSPYLKPGLLAHLQLGFGSGVATTVTVPVVSVKDPIYTPAATAVSPRPTPTATPEVMPPATTPTPSATG